MRYSVPTSVRRFDITIVYPLKTSCTFGIDAYVAGGSKINAAHRMDTHDWVYMKGTLLRSKSFYLINLIPFPAFSAVVPYSDT